MTRISILISRYLLTTVVPYFVFSWLLLSVILFAQQAGRYSEIFFDINIPASLAWQLALALIPNVIAFTCPMAILLGTTIGLTKMQGDSELVAMRASGVGNLHIALPIILLGILLSMFALFINLRGVPLAARLVRIVALETAIAKLESPIEPGVFNTEIAGLTIYVKGGDIETGRWKNIFIYSEDKEEGTLRLITSSAGRIDTTGENSELVLENATVSTLPTMAGETSYISENIAEVRVAIKTKRADLLDKLTNYELTPEELGLEQLADYAAARSGSERIEASILWQRRMILSISPLIFCLLGAAIVLRFNRGGRGFGIFAALVVLIGFYLLAFIGEQVARTGTLNVLIGGLLPIVGSGLIIFWFSLRRKLPRIRRLTEQAGMLAKKARARTGHATVRPAIFARVTTGLRDFDLILGLIKHFALALSFLSAIFLIFTAFDLWKFAGMIDGGAVLLLTYLFYLLPFVYLQIAPSSAMIAILATYVIKSRQNEIVTWTSAGQSVYRLLAPAFILALLLGGANWLIQEKVLPAANRRQDELRTVIRNRGNPTDATGRYWIANDERIYSFSCASDNEIARRCESGKLRNLTVYQFEGNGINLQSVYRANSAIWEQGGVRLLDQVQKSVVSGGKITAVIESGTVLKEPYNPLAKLRVKPSHLTTNELQAQADQTESEVERRNLQLAAQKRNATLFLPFVMALFTAPFSLSLSRKGKAATVGYAVGLWLLFMGTASLFDQLGASSMLPPLAAVWLPLLLFSFLGVFLLSKVKT
ncbi:MAG: LptF/LptG family permease [Pyrinomonadaceae bacterium]